MESVGQTFFCYPTVTFSSASGSLIGLLCYLQFISTAESLDIGSIINKKIIAASKIYQLLIDTDISDSRCLATTPGPKVCENHRGEGCSGGLKWDLREPCRRPAAPTLPTRSGSSKTLNLAPVGLTGRDPALSCPQPWVPPSRVPPFASHLAVNSAGLHLFV